MPVVHAIAARLRPDAEAELVAAATTAAGDLRAAPGVVASCVGLSSEQLAVVVWLPDATALEPFAASPAHMNLVMRGLAPLIEGMWSISIATDRQPPAEAPAAIWAFAVPEKAGVFEWQIRRQLEEIDTLPGIAWVGPTVEERERYRAGGVVLLSTEEAREFAGGFEGASMSALSLETAMTPALTDSVSP